MLCYYKFKHEPSIDSMLGDLWQKSNKLNLVRYGICKEDFAQKKQAIELKCDMDNMWPIEPYPLCVPHEDFR